MVKSKQLFVLASLIITPLTHAGMSAINIEKTAAKTQVGAPAKPPVLNHTAALPTPDHQGSSHSFVYDAWVTTDFDNDYDGYASGFTLSMDIDSYYPSRWVYVRLLIGSQPGHYQSYHVSSDIRIQGESSLDLFHVQTRLTEDYPPDDYSFAIELYDAESLALLDIYDSYDDSDLLYIPLESRDYEHQGQTSISIETHGGSLGIAIMPGLVLLAACRRVKLNPRGFWWPAS